MQITCADCGNSFEADSNSGEVACPHCGGKLPVGPSDDATISVVAGPKSSLSRAGVVVGVTLAADDAAAMDGTRPGSSVQDALSSAKGDQKYAVEDEIARGGMGVILRAIDRDIRRDVAMKLILGTPAEKLRARFVEEAQVTGQLEHPNIVPIHDLGLDASGRLFFTMKLVRGRSLEEALDALREGKPEAERKYTLLHLLNVFVGVCNAMAYSHSKGVVHRDLKPANIMLGDFGEVMVMDWGLAKVGAATHKAREHAGRREGSADKATRAADEEIAQLVSSFRSESGSARTMDGTIAGTPAYMPPEQARGEISKIDARSDVYSLGAILYEMLALAPPVEGRTAYAMLLDAAEGNIAPPEERAPERHIPKELSAVAMKALAAGPRDRYQTVQRLRRDVELFLEGRAVSAKPDTAWETVVKLVRRNKGASVVTAVATIVIVAVVGVGYWFNLKERRIAEHARGVAERERERAEDALTARNALAKKAAPEFLAKSKRLTEEGKFTEALAAIDIAIGLDDSVGDYYVQRGFVLQDLLRFGGSIVAFDKAAQRGAGREIIDANLKLSEKMVKLCLEVKRNAGISIESRPREIMLPWAQALEAQRRFAEATRAYAGQTMPSEAILKRWRTHLLGAGPPSMRKARDSGKRLRLDESLGMHLGLRNVQDVESVEFLRGMPLKTLSLYLCGRLQSLDGLQGMQLKELNLHQCVKVADISALRGMPLEKLNLNMYTRANDILKSLEGLQGTQLKDLDLGGCNGLADISALRGIPLEKLNFGMTVHASNNALTSLDSLQGMKLKTLNLSYCRAVESLAPLRGMPIEHLTINGCRSLKSLDGLQGMQLKELNLHDCRGLADISALRGMKLENLNLAVTAVADISVLAGMPLTRLSVQSTRTADLSPLKGMPLTHLDLYRCGGVSDLGPLAGAPLTTLIIHGTRVTDLTPLKGMPLLYLTITRTAVNDLTPLAGMKLETLIFNGEKITKGLDVVLNMKSILKIGPDPWKPMHPVHFWKKFDADRKKREAGKK